MGSDLPAPSLRLQVQPPLRYQAEPLEQVHVHCERLAVVGLPGEHQHRVGGWRSAGQRRTQY
jgi:hypothetical protein